MVKESLAYVFGSGKRDIYQTADWYQSLKKFASDYGSCKVISFTRVKNLSSDWMHEYVQFIVEDTGSGDRARVFADRANEKDIDIVITGWDRDEIPTDLKSKRELPLPLSSVKFADNDQPTVLEIADILAKTTVIGGPYNFYGHNCFWFANLSYKTVRAKWKTAQDKKWRWVNPTGAGGGGFKDLWGLGWPTVFKMFYAPGAKEFRTERTENKNWRLELTDSSEEDIITSRGLTEMVTDDLLSEPSVEEYRAWREFEGADKLEVTKLSDNMDSAREEAEAISATDEFNLYKQFTEDISELAKLPQEIPEADNLLKLVRGPTGEPADPEYTGNGAEQFVEASKAMDILVAKILQEIDSE